MLLGGQPAAGETRAQDTILTESPELVSITGDNLRRYHLDYDVLVRDDPLGMPAVTTVSGGLIRLALAHALAHDYLVLLDGTFRDSGMVTGTAAGFAYTGYRIEAVAVATPAPVSHRGIALRSAAPLTAARAEGDAP